MGQSRAAQILILEKMKKSFDYQTFFVPSFYLWQTYWSDLVFFFVRIYDGFVENEDGDVVVGRVLVLDLELIVNENLGDFALVILWKKYSITITQ